MSHVHPDEAGVPAWLLEEMRAEAEQAGAQLPEQAGAQPNYQPPPAGIGIATAMDGLGMQGPDHHEVQQPLLLQPQAAVQEAPAPASPLSSSQLLQFYLNEDAFQEVTRTEFPAPGDAVAEAMLTGEDPPFPLYEESDRDSDRDDNPWGGPEHQPAAAAAVGEDVGDEAPQQQEGAYAGSPPPPAGGLLLGAPLPPLQLLGAGEDFASLLAPGAAPHAREPSPGSSGDGSSWPRRRLSFGPRPLPAAPPALASVMETAPRSLTLPGDTGLLGSTSCSSPGVLVAGPSQHPGGALNLLQALGGGALPWPQAEAAGCYSALGGAPTWGAAQGASSLWGGTDVMGGRVLPRAAIPSRLPAATATMGAASPSKTLLAGGWGGLALAPAQDEGAPLHPSSLGAPDQHRGASASCASARTALVNAPGTSIATAEDSSHSSSQAEQPGSTEVTSPRKQAAPPAAAPRGRPASEAPAVAQNSPQERDRRPTRQQVVAPPSDRQLRARRPMASADRMAAAGQPPTMPGSSLPVAAQPGSDGVVTRRGARGGVDGSPAAQQGAIQPGKRSGEDATPPIKRLRR